MQSEAEGHGFGHPLHCSSSTQCANERQSQYSVFTPDFGMRTREPEVLGICYEGLDDCGIG